VLSEVETLAVLGAGGFGRVTLVRYKGEGGGGVTAVACEASTGPEHPHVVQCSDAACGFHSWYQAMHSGLSPVQMSSTPGICVPAGKIYALKQMAKAHILDNKLVAHVHREKNVSTRAPAVQ